MKKVLLAIFMIILPTASPAMKAGSSKNMLDHEYTDEELEAIPREELDDYCKKLEAEIGLLRGNHRLPILVKRAWVGAVTLLIANLIITHPRVKQWCHSSYDRLKQMVRAIYGKCFRRKSAAAPDNESKES